MKPLGPDQLDEIMAALERLDVDDVQTLMGACAAEILNREASCAGRSYAPGQMFIAYGAGPAADVLEMHWQVWREEGKV